MGAGRSVTDNIESQMSSLNGSKADYYSIIPVSRYSASLVCYPIPNPSKRSQISSAISQFGAISSFLVVALLVCSSAPVYEESGCVINNKNTCTSLTWSRPKITSSSSTSRTRLESKRGHCLTTCMSQCRYKLRRQLTGEFVCVPLLCLGISFRCSRLFAFVRIRH